MNQTIERPVKAQSGREGGLSLLVMLFGINVSNFFIGKKLYGVYIRAESSIETSEEIELSPSSAKTLIVCLRLKLNNFVRLQLRYCQTYDVLCAVVSYCIIFLCF